MISLWGCYNCPMNDSVLQILIYIKNETNSFWVLSPSSWNSIPDFFLLSWKSCLLMEFQRLCLIGLYWNICDNAYIFLVPIMIEPSSQLRVLTALPQLLTESFLHHDCHFTFVAKAWWYEIQVNKLKNRFQNILDHRGIEWRNLQYSFALKMRFFFL